MKIIVSVLLIGKMLLLPNLLEAQSSNIEGLRVVDLTVQQDSLGNTSTDSLVYYKVSFEIGSITDTKKLFINAGSANGGTDGLSQIYEIQSISGLDVFKDMNDVPVAQLKGNEICFIFSIESGSLANFVFWEVCEEHYDGSQSAKEKFTVQ